MAGDEFLKWVKSLSIDGVEFITEYDENRRSIYVISVFGGTGKASAFLVTGEMLENDDYMDRVKSIYPQKISVLLAKSRGGC